MKKLIMFLLIVCAMYSSTFADDFDFDFGKQVSGSDVLDFAEEGTKAFELELSGEVEFRTRAYLDTETRIGVGRTDPSIETNPELTLNVKAKKKNSEAIAVVKFNEDSNTGELYEGYLRLNYDKFSIEAGKMIVVWGKGDIRHAVDILNADDFSDFVNVPHEERRTPATMLKLNYFSGDNGKTELVYMPFGNSMFGNDTKWINFPSETVNEGDLNKGRVALRYTNSMKGIDFGLMAQGDFSTTKITVKDLNLGPLGILPNMPTGSERENQYMIGGELATQILGLNTRFEGVYATKGDMKGTDAGITNDTVNVLCSFDKKLPIHNLNLLFEYYGMLILKTDKITENQKEFTQVRSGLESYISSLAVDSVERLTYEGMLAQLESGAFQYRGDRDYLSTEEEYQINILYTKLTDSYMNDKIKASFTYAYYLSGNCFSIEPKVTFKLLDNTTLEIKYMEYSDDLEEVFNQDFSKNDFAQIKFEYKF